MNPTRTHLALLGLLCLAPGCRSKRQPTPKPASINAPTTVQPVAGVGALAMGAAPAPAVDPLWPQWLPALDGVRRRESFREVFGGDSAQGGVETLINVRRSLERAGYTLTQTSVRRQPWEQRFIFAATRGEEFNRVEVVWQPARPTRSDVQVTNGALGRTMMARRR
jgi:hypothetical protein